LSSDHNWKCMWETHTECRRRGTVWKSCKNGKTLKMRRENDSRSCNGIHVMFVGRRRQKAARTKSFPSLLLLCTCKINVERQTVQNDQQRVLLSSDEAQAQLVMESRGTSYIMWSTLPSRRWPSCFGSLRKRQDK